MKFIKIRTRAFLPPKDNLYPALDKYLPPLKEGDILFITSKVLAIHQGRTVKINPKVDKNQLIKKEAQKYIFTKIKQQKFILTIKDNTLIPSSGIDESNGNGYYVLWPKNTNRLCREICIYLKKKHKVKKLAVVATDSHTTPLRWGVSGISIGFFGMEPVADYRGKKDIFGRPLKYTRANIVDVLANMAVLLMGEAGEKTPMLILREASFVQFNNKNNYHKLVIGKKADLYYPMLKIFDK